jgi:ParB-like chromosome segregation protein Spo0J
MYQRIPITRLIPHPENSNRMDPQLMKKLELNIRKSGEYETITVRPHPQLPGDFQILNGHHRIEILKRIGMDEVKCDVWEIDDAQARLLLATLNRLEGKDVAEMRAILISNLMDDFDISQLNALVPESGEELERLLELSKEDFKEIEEQLKELSSHLECDLPDLRMLDFILNADQYRTVVNALDEMVRKQNLEDRSEALHELVRWYSENAGPPN